MFSLDLHSREPIYEQLYNRVLDLAASGVMKENEQLPPVRVLAKELGVNPNTVQKAYQELERNGIIYSQGGRGSFIAASNEVSAVAKRNAHEKFTDATQKALLAGYTKNELKQIIDKTEQKGESTE